MAILSEFEEKGQWPVLFVTGSLLYLGSATSLIRSDELVDLLGLSCYTGGRRYCLKLINETLTKEEIAMKIKTFTLSVAFLAILSLIAAYWICQPAKFTVSIKSTKSPLRVL